MRTARKSFHASISRSKVSLSGESGSTGAPDKLPETVCGTSNAAHGFSGICIQ